MDDTRRRRDVPPPNITEPSAREPNVLPVPTQRPPGGQRPYLVPGPVPPPASERQEAATQDPTEEIARLRAERDEYVEAVRRLAAEFDNYRKRMLREQTAYMERAAERVILRLLPLLDTLELGARHNPEALDAVHRQFLEVLAAEGLCRVEPLGERFDPAEHEAAEHGTVVPLRSPASPSSDTRTTEFEPEATVADVIRPGYRLRGHLLRPALVRVEW